ncbi:hypothetical protein AOLI_G00071400 [Acnodon oligacanthus]
MVPCAREKGVSWLAHTFSTRHGILFGPTAFQVKTLISALLTLSIASVLAPLWSGARHGVLFVLIHCGQTQEKPKLRVEPQSPDTVTLSCELPQSTGWTIIWKKNSILQHDLTTITETLPKEGGAEFKCLARRGYSYTPPSDLVKITVVEKPKATVKVQPADHVFIRERVTLTCEIESGDDWNYEWYKNNNLLRDAERKKYEISNVDQTHAAVYTCKGKQSTGRIYTHTSEAVTLTVSERLKATVKVQPADHVFIRERVTLTCEIESGDDWNYEWYKNNNLLRDAERKKYEISNVDQTHAGVYTCKGKQSTGRIYTHTSEAVTLTVSVTVKPTITSNHEGAALAGNTVTLYCKLHQSAGWTFYWTKHTQNSENETIANVYSISSVSLSDGGQYWCRAGRGNPVYYTDYSDALWVNVTGVSSSGAPVSALSRLSSLMAVSPYLLVSIVLGVKCYRARAPGSGSTELIAGVSVGLSLVLFLIIILGLICCCKKSKGDSAAQPSDVTYTQIVTTKNRKGNNEGATRPNDVTYSQIQMKNLEHHEKGL